MKAVRELIAVVAVLCAIFSVVFNYAALPERIPTHFDAAGIVNGWGDKSSLWDLLGVLGFVYLALTLIRFLPANLINVPVGPERRAAAIPLAIEMIGWVKAETSCLFAVMITSTVAIAQGRRLGLSPWLLPVALGVVFGTCGFYVGRMRMLKV